MTSRPGMYISRQIFWLRGVSGELKGWRIRASDAWFLLFRWSSGRRSYTSVCFVSFKNASLGCKQSLRIAPCCVNIYLYCKILYALSYFSNLTTYFLNTIQLYFCNRGKIAGNKIFCLFVAFLIWIVISSLPNWANELFIHSAKINKQTNKQKRDDGHIFASQYFFP